MKLVYVAMGSNIGDGRKCLLSGIKMLETFALGEIRYSSFWNTEPVEMIDQSWFTNAVVEFYTDLSPIDLLKSLQMIENNSGRPSNHLRNASRTLDLDIISYGNYVLETDFLELPHPRACQRLFVLIPLQELAPEFQFPGDDRSLSDLIQVAPSIKIERLDYLS